VENDHRFLFSARLWKKTLGQNGKVRPAAKTLDD
jgi:hypothetical protein